MVLHIEGDCAKTAKGRRNESINTKALCKMSWIGEIRVHFRVQRHGRRFDVAPLSMTLMHATMSDMIGGS